MQSDKPVVVILGSGWAAHSIMKVRPPAWVHGGAMVTVGTTCLCSSPPLHFVCSARPHPCPPWLHLHALPLHPPGYRHRQL